MLLRKEKGDICSGKHYSALHSLLRLTPPLEGKGGSRQRIGGNVRRSGEDLLPFILMSDQDVFCWLLSFWSLSGPFPVPKEMTFKKKCVFINVPLECRPPAKSGNLLRLLQVTNPFSVGLLILANRFHKEQDNIILMSLC